MRLSGVLEVLVFRNRALYPHHSIPVLGQLNEHREAVSKSSNSSPLRLFTVVLQSHSSSSQSCSIVTGPCHFILFSLARV